jgi:hypothetical protein
VEKDLRKSPQTSAQSACYDLIGDVHGYLDLLESLVEQLGYTRKGKSYEHPEGRKLIFVGDLINRGPNSIGVLRAVRETCEQGNGFLTLGNHEFKVLQLDAANKPLPNTSYESFLPWLKTIPLFLDLEEIRVVHAAWHFSSISYLSESQLTKDEFIQRTCDKTSPERKAVDLILKGVKADLPIHSTLCDRFKKVRKKGRLRWWEDLKGKPFSEALFSPMYGKSIIEFPKLEDIIQVEPYPKDEKLVFTGHYCLEPHVPKINENIACLDGCVTCDKKLWAYRHNRNNKLSEENLVYAEY